MSISPVVPDLQTPDQPNAPDIGALEQEAATNRRAYLQLLIDRANSPDVPPSPDQPGGYSPLPSGRLPQQSGGFGSSFKHTLKGMLSNFLTGAAESLAESSGINEGNLRRAQAAHLNAQTGLINRQMDLMGTTIPVQMPNGALIHVPANMAKDILAATIKGQYSVQAAGTNKRFITTPNGLYDTQNLDANGMPSLLPNSGAGVQITPEIAEQYGIPQDFLGKFAKLTDLAAMERGNAMQYGFTMGAGGPVSANKVTGVGNPVTVNGQPVGNPGVAVADARARAAAKYGVAITDNGDTVSRLDALQHGLKLASGNPLIRPGLKGYEDAYYADARLRQMQQQAQDQTGASDMALLFNHIAMTGGNVKGMSMGEHITMEHAKARSIPEELAVLWNHAVDGQTLSPQQRQNFLKLAVEVRNSTWQRAAMTGKAYGIDPSGVEQDPELPQVDLTNFYGAAPSRPHRNGAPPKPSSGSDWRRRAIPIGGR